ncbi:MAG: hypothetical protein FWC36_03980 [Spirochaetes bacterium]|nr:hypothetical protein [Spirochaetota bacterium]
MKKLKEYFIYAIIGIIFLLSLAGANTIGAIVKDSLRIFLFENSDFFEKHFHSWSFISSFIWVIIFTSILLPMLLLATKFIFQKLLKDID